MTLNARLTAALMAISCFIAGMGRAAHGANYYVDFAAGSDTNSGVSPALAWKHCPGDKNAEAISKTAQFTAGDEIIFKGGVSYRGTLNLPSGGAKGKPIVYDGNTAGTFGKGPAIIDGSELITGWHAATSADEVSGNPNWKHLLIAHIPASVNPMGANLFEGSKLAWTAQEPNLKDPFYFDDLSTFRSIPAKNVSVTSVMHPDHLDQADAHAWDDATMIFWGTPNLVYQRKVISFDPASHTLRFEKVPGVYKDRPSRYAIANCLRVLDQPGESVVTETKNDAGMRTIYYWPQEETNPAKISVTYSARIVGVDLAGKSFITLQGFIIQKQGGERAVGLTNNGGKVDGVLVRNNEIRWCRSSERSNAVSLPDLTHSVVEGNNVHENVRSRGLAFNGGDNLIVQHNTLTKNGGTGIAFFTCVHSKMMYNMVRDHNGVHANGLTVYVNSSDVLIFGNQVYNSNIAMTTQKSKNITIAYNILTGASFYILADWDGCDGLKIVNNVILADKSACTVSIGKTTKNVVFKNNICGGQSVERGKEKASISNNIYTVLSPTQKNDKLEPGSLFNADMAAIFVDPAKHDYRLKAGSPAIDAGVEVGLVKDLAGAPVPQGKTVDIGAYEYKQ